MGESTDDDWDTIGRMGGRLAYFVYFGDPIKLWGAGVAGTFS